LAKRSELGGFRKLQGNSHNKGATKVHEKSPFGGKGRKIRVNQMGKESGVETYAIS